MTIYIDEDLASGLLIRLLQKAGHDVEAAAGADLLGRSDPVQLTFATHEGRACLTANYRHFEELHLLIRPLTPTPLPRGGEGRVRGRRTAITPAFWSFAKTTIPPATLPPKASWPRFANWRRPLSR